MVVGGASHSARFAVTRQIDGRAKGLGAGFAAGGGALQVPRPRRPGRATGDAVQVTGHRCAHGACHRSRDRGEHREQQPPRHGVSDTARSAAVDSSGSSPHAYWRSLSTVVIARSSATVRR